MEGKFFARLILSLILPLALSSSCDRVGAAKTEVAPGNEKPTKIDTSVPSRKIANVDTAATEMVLKCAALIPEDAGKPACAGVKTEADIYWVVRCTKLIEPAAGKPACTGVKSQGQTDWVVRCTKEITPPEGMPACIGVQSDYEIETVVQCAKAIGGTSAIAACRLRPY